MKEKLTNIILKHCDGDLMIINLSGMVNEIEEMLADGFYPLEPRRSQKEHVDWAGLDPVKWGGVTLAPAGSEELKKIMPGDCRKLGDINMEEI